MPETQTLSYADAPPTPRPLTMTLRVQLSIMMFLQYAIWGAWFSTLSLYLGALKFTPVQIGMAYGATALASMFSPLVFGQIADRWVPTQRLLAFLHLAGAACLYLATQYTSFTAFYGVILLYCVLYMPTLALTNSLGFYHIPDAARQFPAIRVFGTIGWIAIGLLVGATLQQESTQPLLMAAVLSLVMGVYCLTLPHTPPTGKAGDTLPFIKALELLKQPSFGLFLLVSFFIAVILAGYFTWVPQFLDQAGIKKVAAVMTIGQMTEMVLLLLLPFFLKTIGIKWTLVLGMAAWGIRYACFAVGAPAALVILGIALHGICYDFFFVAGYIHVDNRASSDIRASAQALFNLVVMGLGMFLGNIAFGKLTEHFTVNGAVDWRHVWGYPAAAVIIALVVFIIGFREKDHPTAA